MVGHAHLPQKCNLMLRHTVHYQPHFIDNFSLFLNAVKQFFSEGGLGILKGSAGFFLDAHKPPLDSLQPIYSRPPADIRVHRKTAKPH